MNVCEEALVFPDGSTYKGQVLRTSGKPQPHGWGKMTTTDGFEMRGFFHGGKAQGPGRFTAPNGDTFFGNWNEEHKRHGNGLAVKADGKRLIESYDASGKLLKRVRQNAPKPGIIRWNTEMKFGAEGGEGPCARNGHTATAMMDGNLVVVFGGQTEKEGLSTSLNDVHLLDVETNEWIEAETYGASPPPMHGHTATSVDNLLIVIGGQNGLEVSSAVYVLDIDTGEWTCPVTKGVSFVDHTATLVEDNIFVVVQSSVFCLNVDTFAWTECKVDMRALGLKSGRSFINHTAVAVGTMIFVFGGKILGLQSSGGLKQSEKQWHKCSSELRILHTDTLSWEVPNVQPPDMDQEAKYSGVRLGSWDCPRSEHTATLVGDKMYVIGGWTSSNPKMNVIDQSYLHDVQVLSLDTMTWWQPLLRYPEHLPRAGHTAVLVKDKIMVFGGKNFADFALTDWSELQTGKSATARKKSSVTATDKAPAPAASDVKETTTEKPEKSENAGDYQNSQQFARQDSHSEDKRVNESIADVGAAMQSPPGARSAPRRKWDKSPAGSVGQQGGNFVSAGSGSVLDLFKNMQMGGDGNP
mmetsp:Transcript_6753/g.12768  ORF Transcript_6753/g.12768 Transcript_6753/m.12768 type:complete len:581 (-) Transcript_6753:87-1829(-)